MTKSSIKFYKKNQSEMRKKRAEHVLLQKLKSEQRLNEKKKKNNNKIPVRKDNPTTKIKIEGIKGTIRDSTCKYSFYCELDSCKNCKRVEKVRQ